MIPNAPDRPIHATVRAAIGFISRGAGPRLLLAALIPALPGCAGFDWLTPKPAAQIGRASCRERV